jgi:hypothetical protein
MSLEQYKDANRKELWEILQIQVEHIAELEKEKETLTQHHGMWKDQWHELNSRLPILYIEAKIDGVELVADWIDGYYAPCVVGVVDELAEELKKLREGK